MQQHGGKCVTKYNNIFL